MRSSSSVVEREISWSLYRWIYFSRAVLFCQPHQQLFAHSLDDSWSFALYTVMATDHPSDPHTVLLEKTKGWWSGVGCCRDLVALLMTPCLLRRSIPGGDVPRQPERPHHPVPLRPHGDRSLHHLGAVVRRGCAGVPVPRAHSGHAGRAGAGAGWSVLPQRQLPLLTRWQWLRPVAGGVLAPSSVSHLGTGWVRVHWPWWEVFGRVGGWRSGGGFCHLHWWNKSSEVHSRWMSAASRQRLWKIKRALLPVHDG